MDNQLEKIFNKRAIIKKIEEFLFRKRNLWIIIVIFLQLNNNCSQSDNIFKLYVKNNEQKKEIIELKQYIEKIENNIEIKLLENRIEFINEIEKKDIKKAKEDYTKQLELRNKRLEEKNKELQEKTQENQ